MGKREGAATIHQCRHLESRGTFSHRRERQAPAGAHRSLRIAEGLGDVTFPTWLRFQGTTGPVQLPSDNKRPPLHPCSPTCTVSPPPLKLPWLCWHEPIFSFCCHVRFLPAQCARTAQCRIRQEPEMARRKGWSARTRTGLRSQPLQLRSPWSHSPNLAPPLRQCEYPTMLPSPDVIQAILSMYYYAASVAAFDSQPYRLPNRH